MTERIEPRLPVAGVHPGRGRSLYNYGWLAAIVLVNLGSVYLILFQRPPGSPSGTAVLLAAAGAAAIVITKLMGANARNRIAFRRWRDSSPAARAFSRFMLQDPRIDAELLRRRYDPLPMKPEEQERLWYEIYVKHRSAPHVVDAVSHYTLARDAAVVVALLAVAVLPLAVMAEMHRAVEVGVVALLVAEYFLASAAATRLAAGVIVSVLVEESRSG